MCIRDRTYYDVKVDDDVISTDFRVVVNDVYYDGTYQEPTVKVYDLSLIHILY